MGKTKRRREVAGSRFTYTVHITLFWNDVLCKYSRIEMKCNYNILDSLGLLSPFLIAVGFLFLPCLLHCFPEREQTTNLVFVLARSRFLTILYFCEAKCIILCSFFLVLSFCLAPPSSPPFSRSPSMVATCLVPRLLPSFLLSSPLASHLSAIFLSQILV